jgi:hypothetical protein
MKPLKEYHHFREELIDPNDRLAKCERYIINLLLHSNLPDSERESSIYWELKHQASTLQFAKILACKRGLPEDICAIGLILHDVYSIVHGKYKNHAYLGTSIAMEILHEIGDFSEEELDHISRVIRHHSDKDVWSNDPFQEIGKDVDVLDCFLYEGAFDYYLGNKPLSIFKEYLSRAKNVWNELGLPKDPRFDLLDDYELPWFQHLQTFKHELMKDILAILLDLSAYRKESDLCPPPFCILVEGDASRFYANQQTWTKYARNLSSKFEDTEFDRKYGILLSIPGLIAKQVPDHRITEQCISLVNKGIISEKILKKTKNILPSIQDSLHHEKYALIFWPFVEIYESLSGEKMIKRLKEFGLEPSRNIMEV